MVQLIIIVVIKIDAQVRALKQIFTKLPEDSHSNCALENRKKTYKYSCKSGTEYRLYFLPIALLSVFTFFHTNVNFDLTNALNSNW